MIKPRLDFSDEIIDDSEPERIEHRRAQDSQRTHPTDQMGGERYQKIIDVIEITDDERLDNVPHPKSIEGAAVTLTSSESDGAMDIATSTSLRLPEVEIDTLNVANSALPAERHQTFSSSSPQRTRQKQHIDEDETILTKLDLARFAHKVTNDTSRFRPPAPPTGTKQRSRAKAYQLAPDFSDAYLARMAKCVCCDIPWRTSKTAAVKMRHVLSCAKQHGIDDNTLESAIRNEIERLSVDVLKGDGPQKVLPSSEAQKTLFEDLVTSTVSKKKTRPQATRSSVTIASLTRKATLDRARVVLEQRSSTLAGPYLDHNINMQSALHHDDEFSPGTQKFAPSKLGATRRGTQLLPSTSSYPDKHDAFLESSHNPSCKNASTKAVNGRCLRAGIENPPEKAPLHTGSERTIPSLQIAQLAKVIPISPEIYPLDRFYGFDDVCLHRDLGIRDLCPVPSKHTEPVTLDVKPSKLNVSRTPRGRKKTVPNPRDAFDEEEIMIRIMCDQQLYLRILRYEPIHFNVFLKLLTPDVVIVSGKIKLQLRAFLDGQAINFYGADRTSKV
ncbi:uncharacterized protein LACBIDRAFT_292945 [Laccaria bicolor S238N-H82]|uniref:Predicted protein n=1 Tax=Laccaria bicolor (strain S238N-H82 / ATCC MYA-4686) TaxID=486041 RepID=B0CYP5_LACBS|nr:uncharacterized protein LACBIDRAFT_292945 [Laccaria bicolor S238N-H82]EDR12487.1 predicted protein [Laccaria bicolor S238N-H82]|eukprot:XP_001876751.1 predicted protein [Laccaria bicolor S238N-H82]